MKKLLGKSSFDQYLNSLKLCATHGMTINFHKLRKSSIDLDYLISKFELFEVYKNQNYAYYTYDKEKLADKGIYPGKDPLHHAGLYYIQEPSAAKVLFEVPFEASDVVLDLCASPGGKTIQALYSLNKNEGGFLVSNEIDYKRAKVLNSNIERMGFDNVAITSAKSQELSNCFNDYFDKIIVDAPCSGEGMFRKSEEARKQWSLSLVKSCASIQRTLVDDAYNMLKRDGILIYSTCTFSKEEDEEVVDYLLNKYSDLELIKMEKSYPFNSLGEGQFYSIIKKAGENGYKTIAPKMEDFSGINIIRYGVREYEEENSKDNNKSRTNKKSYKNDLMKPTHESTHTDDIEFDNVVDLDDAEIIKYLKGEVIKKDLSFNGYCKITYKNIGIGLAKYTNGVLKNHYPKGLRLL